MKEPIVFFMIEYETRWYIEKIGSIKQKPLTSDLGGEEQGKMPGFSKYA